MLFFFSSTRTRGLFEAGIDFATGPHVPIRSARIPDRPAMIADRRRLHSALAAVRSAAGEGKSLDAKGRGSLWVRLQADLRASLGRCAARRGRSRKSPSTWTCRSRPGGRKSPRPSREHHVVIVCGETGSGKSTQLPKICLEMGRGVAG